MRVCVRVHMRRIHIFASADVLPYPHAPNSSHHHVHARAPRTGRLRENAHARARIDYLRVPVRARSSALHVRARAHARALLWQGQGGAQRKT
jgi:hypothetical protein